MQPFLGWMDEFLMVQYYIPHLRKNLPSGESRSYCLIIFLLTEKVFDAMEQNKISFIHLPPNTTPIIQPLDVGLNGPFKAKINKTNQIG